MSTIWSTDIFRASQARDQGNKFSHKFIYASNELNHEISKKCEVRDLNSRLRISDLTEHSASWRIKNFDSQSRTNFTTKE